MAQIGEPDRWWYEPETNPLEVPIAPAEEPATPAPSVEPVPA